MGISSETSSESSDNEDEWGLGNNGIGSIVQHALRMARRMHIQEIVQETDSGEEESEGESEEEDINFQERYELFVGNLPNDIRRDSLRLALNDRLSVNSVVDVKDLIRPARGRAFAFVRCNSERAFEELVNAEVVIMLFLVSVDNFILYIFADFRRQSSSNCKKSSSDSKKDFCLTRRLCRP